MSYRVSIDLPVGGSIRGFSTMARELRARFSQGKIEPLESIDLEEGEEVTIVVKERAQALDARRDAIARAAGAWRGTLDFDAFLADIYENRRRPARDVNL